MSLFALAATACGGGGGGGSTMAGTVRTESLRSSHTGNGYPVHIYVPPGDAAARAAMPVVYLLDGDSRFNTLVDIVETSRTRVIIAAIGNEARRNEDYVPSNTCTMGGGGQVAYLNFIRLELTPYIEANVGGHPLRRVLLGHSHGGSFVLYALFAEGGANRHFAAYLSSDASIACMQDTVYGWEAAYAAAHTTLPTRLHLAHAANVANIDFAAQLRGRRYSGLTLAAHAYGGGHVGMIPVAFADAL
ncbi:MAG: alpha/beta hydrolase-fold protein, partial [Rubrivivax sp.]|nr:alpha/beta hydrolase-fold protein [Rubrivivax sp.]